MRYLDLEPHIIKRQALSAALTLFSWDQETEAPAKSIENTSKYIGVLSKEYFLTMTSAEVKEILNDLSNQQLSINEAAVVRDWLKDIDKLDKIPVDLYQSHQELLSKAQHVWQEAKVSNNYEMFKPYLLQIVENEKQFAKYRQVDNVNLYDILLNDYEPGFTIAKLDNFFSLLQSEIVPLLAKIKTSDKVIDTSFLRESYSVDKQKEFNNFLAKYLGFDFEAGVIKESEHPFTTNFHKNDVRFTTHYYEKQLDSAIFSTIHETGHGLYEQGIGDDIALSPIGTGASMGIHESQSRFYENIIGRSNLFWGNIYGQLQQTFPNLKEVSLDQFNNAINVAQASLIRTEADELTYSLHIMIRYEMEKLIFNSDVDYDQLPNIWNNLYEKYLGICPTNYSEGILQDVHWSGGMFGYFPSYAIGSAIASQIYNYMKANTEVDEWISSGDFESIKLFLNKHIHQHGCIYNTDELLEMLTGEPFNPKYYVEYLKEKFTKVYEL